MTNRARPQLFAMRLMPVRPSLNCTCFTHSHGSSDRGNPATTVHCNAAEAIGWAIDTVVAGGPCSAAESRQSLSVISIPSSTA
jgi:hypothetical protein